MAELERYLLYEAGYFKKPMAMTQYLRTGLVATMVIAAAMVIAFWKWTPQAVTSTQTSNVDPYALHKSTRLQSMLLEQIEDMAFVFPASRR